MNPNYSDAQRRMLVEATAGKPVSVRAEIHKRVGDLLRPIPRHTDEDYHRALRNALDRYA